MVSTRSTSSSLTPGIPPTTPRAAIRSRSTSRPPASSSWVHVPDTVTLLWLAVSLPLVAWDTGYIMLRPRSMPGGSLHWPLWVPYKLYGEVDHVYGFKQWDLRNGFTAAQGALNIVESLCYLAYLYLWRANGRPSARAGGRLGVAGRPAALAVMLAFSAAVMTLSKTVLYWANEYFSGFDNIGHNDMYSLIVLWIIPNGAWIVFSAYMIYKFGGEIVAVLTAASGRASKND
ncbi:uncharacterized protein E0L32_005794 [Thyridium curvatum]|uniref:C6 transcription factor n=1 Tax=Thyridium curvatum TaxID=1093900 RepID=A0A507BB75_9PEZI|nr:uncharacterized protein E0L32_005794 [Thyridium curvatum]TPX13850.1 hypothetical protein E0L32_005794 [Thyridium curvatum]